MMAVGTAAHQQWLIACHWDGDSLSAIETAGRRHADSRQASPVLRHCFVSYLRLLVGIFFRGG